MSCATSLGWPKPRGYHPDLFLSVPKDLENSVVAWEYLKLDSDEIEKKHEAILRYLSQNKYAPTYLVTFDRQNELFGDYPTTVIYRQMAKRIAPFRNLYPGLGAFLFVLKYWSSTQRGAQE